MGLEHLADDSRFSSHALRTKHNRELISVLSERFAAMKRDEWANRLDEERCIWAPVQTLDELIVDPQVSANGYTTTLQHSEEGEFQLVSAPMQFERTPGEAKAPAPELGQDTEMVLLDLGYTWEDISALKEQGAII